MSKKSVPEIPNSHPYTPIEKSLIGIHLPAHEQIPDVNLKYYDSTVQCFSEWDKSELKLFSEFVNKLSKQTWQMVLRSGGKGENKAGMGYTVIDRGQLPACNTISDDVTFFELRVSQKARVHGFRVKCSFYLVFLDKDHKILK